MHKFSKSHIQLWHNSLTNQFQMSQVCIHQTHLSSTIIIHMQQLRLMPIWYAPIHDTYMHVVPNSSKVVTSWCNKNIIVNGYNQRIYGYKYPVNGNMDITSDTTYDAWTYDSITHAYVHNNSTAICIYMHSSPITPKLACINSPPTINIICIQ